MNMFEKYFTLLVFAWWLQGDAGAASLGDFTKSLQKKCQQVSGLVIKKTALELRSHQDCQATFSKQLLASCPQLSCEYLLSEYRTYIMSRQGAVVGD
jgi:hypothetical protein